MRQTNGKVSRKIRSEHNTYRGNVSTGYVIRLPTNFVERTNSRHAIVEVMDSKTVTIKLVD